MSHVCQFKKIHNIILNGTCTLAEKHHLHCWINFCLLCRGCSLLRRGGLLSGSGGLLLRRGHRLLRPGGCLSCLLRCGGLLSGSGGRLLRRGHLLFRLLCRGGGLLSGSGGLLLHRGGSQFHPYCQICPGSLLRLGALLFRLRLSPQFLHGPGPPSLTLFRLCSTTLLVLMQLGASGSRSIGSITNLVHGLLANCHQRSLSLLIDSHTALPITSPWTPFPIILARTHHRLQSPVSHHLISTHTINTTQTGSQCWLLTLHLHLVI